jgi:hypothetical protein
MKMIKTLASVVCLLFAAHIMAGCGIGLEDSGHGDGVWRWGDLRPPLGLVSFAGDGQVTLVWDSANSHEERYPPSAFSIYMATGDFTDSSCVGPICKEQLVWELADEDEGPVCGDLGLQFSQNRELTERGGILPALIDEISNYVVPGIAARQIVNGEPMTDLVALAEEIDDWDDDDDDDTEIESDQETGPGAIELANGTTYTFFVTVRAAEDYSAESFTSNWVAETPRAEIDGLSMAIGDCYDLDSLDYAKDCTDASDIKISLINESRLLILISGINGAQLIDAGAVNSFNDVGEAPDVDDGVFIPTGAGVIALQNHVYVVYTNSGYYGKIYVYAMYDMVNLYEGDEKICGACIPTENTTLTIQAALQTNGRLLKK